MGKLLLASAHSSQISTTVLDKRELLYDVDNNIIWYGNGTVTGGISLATAAGGGGGSINFSAAGSSINLTNIVWSNANGVTFGLTGSTMTASVNAAAGGSINFSAGTTSQNLTNIVWSNANGISFGLNGSTITASHNALTTARRSTDGIGLNTAGTNITWTVNSSGISINAGAYLTTAMASDAGSNFVNTSQSSLFQATSLMSNYQSAGAYLTTAALSQNTSNYAGINSAITNGLMTVNTSGISLNLSNHLTTARASNDAIGLNTALTANGVSVTANSSGLSLNFPAFLTTAAQSNHSHGNPTLNLTNLSGTTASNSAGFTLNLSAAAAGGGGAINVSAGTTSGNLQTLQFDNGNGVSFGLNGSTVTASVNAGGGAAYTALTYQNRQLGASGTTQGQNSVFLVPMRIVAPVSISTLLQMVSITGASSSNTGSVGITYDMAIYKITQATNLSRFDTIWSSQFLMTGFMSSSNSAGYTVNGGASGQNYTSASANSNLLTQIGGIRQITFNMNTVYDTGLYAFGFRMSSSSVGNSAAIQTFRPVIDNPLPLANGNGFGAATNASIGYVDGGTYSVTSNAMPASFVFSEIRQTLNAVPYVKMGAV